MKLVDAGEKGVSVKLNPLYENKIFTDKTAADEDVVIVKGRVVRVDAPSAAMGRALLEPQLHPAEPGKVGGPLLIETDEDPTPVAQPLSDRLTALDTEQQRAILEREAARLGLTLQEATVGEGESTDLANKKRITGQALIAAKDTGNKEVVK
jgi:hypothetical protein